MNTNKTVKNWKWWVALPIVLTFLAVALIPMTTIMVLEFLIVIVEFTNFGEKHSVYAKRLTNWVNR